jgi:hypothetical protein
VGDEGVGDVAPLLFSHAEPTPSADDNAMPLKPPNPVITPLLHFPANQIVAAHPPDLLSTSTATRKSITATENVLVTG